MSSLSTFDENSGLNSDQEGEEAEIFPSSAKRKAADVKDGSATKAGNYIKTNTKPTANANMGLNKNNGQGQFQKKSGPQSAQQHKANDNAMASGPEGIDEVVTLKGLNANGTPAEGGDVELKVNKKARRKFDERILTNRDGLLRIYQEFPTACKFRGIGHEAQDAKLLINKYKEWAFQLYPNLAFPDMLSRCESLGGKAVVRAYSENLRERERCRYLNEVLGVDLALIRVPDRRKAAEEDAEANAGAKDDDDSSSEGEDEEEGEDGGGWGGGARRSIATPDLKSSEAPSGRGSDSSALRGSSADTSGAAQAGAYVDDEDFFAAAEKAYFESQQQQQPLLQKQIPLSLPQGAEGKPADERADAMDDVELEESDEGEKEEEWGEEQTQPQ